jgi:hypothetical protein
MKQIKNYKKGMETNETKKGKYNKKNFLKNPKMKKPNFFFLQTSNLHPNKNIYKTIIKIENTLK